MWHVELRGYVCRQTDSSSHIYFLPISFLPIDISKEELQLALFG